MNINLAKNGFVSLIAGISLIATSTHLHAGQPIEKIEESVIKQLTDCLGADHTITQEFSDCTTTMKAQLNAFFDEGNKQRPQEHVTQLLANLNLLKHNVIDKIEALNADHNITHKQKETLARIHTRLVKLSTDATIVCSILQEYIKRGCSTSLSDLIMLADKLSSRKNLLPKNLRDLNLIVFKDRLVTRLSCK